MWKGVSQRAVRRAAASWARRVPMATPRPSSSVVMPHRPRHGRGCLRRGLASSSRSTESRGPGNPRKRVDRTSPPRKRDAAQKAPPAASVAMPSAETAGDSHTDKEVQGILNQFMRTLNGIEQEFQSELPPLAPVWAGVVPASGGDGSDGGVAAAPSAPDGLYRTTRRAARLLEEYVLAHRSAALRHPHELAALFERILQLYRRSCPAGGGGGDDTRPAAAAAVLRLMREWHLDIQQRHSDQAVEIAARAGRWREAADLFWDCIDPDRSGYHPYDVAIDRPVGLYAVARAAQESGIPAVESTVAAVLRMSMVSSADQETYLLAAGTALGLAGEWDAFVDYLRTSDEANTFKQTLVASVMNACLICDRPNETIKVFDDLVGGVALADEWQWGGGQDRLDFRCRNLAMRALAHRAYHGTGVSRRSYALFNEAVACDDRISREALRSIFASFEVEGHWDDAMTLLFQLLETTHAPIVSVSDYENAASEVGGTYFCRILASVMRSCNAAGQFGSAILAYQFYQLSTSTLHHDASDVDTTVEDALVQTSLPGLSNTDDAQEVLNAVMVSLSGLGCYSAGIELRQAVEAVSTMAVHNRMDIIADFLTHHCQSSTTNDSYETPRFTSCYDYLVQVTKACYHRNHFDHEFQSGGSLSTVIGMAIHSLNLHSQPAAGLQLMKWLRLPLPKKSFDETIVKNRTQFESSIEVTDRLLASIMDACTLTGDAAHAIALFESNVDWGTLSSWHLSSISAIRALKELSGSGAADALFQKTAEYCPSPELFDTAIRNLNEDELPNKILDIYHLAVSCGCWSENLSMRTLQALSKTRVQGRFRMLRSFIEEICSFLETEPADWMRSRYWQLRSLMELPVLYGLMWWSDRETGYLDELNFVLEMLEDQSSPASTPPNDALCLILRRARDFHPDDIPLDKPGLAHIPRDKEEWLNVIRRVLDEAHDSGLTDNPAFVADGARALIKHDGIHESVCFINSALNSGVVLDESILLEVVNASASADVHPESLDPMTLLRPTKS